MERMIQISDYGKAVKHRLLDMDMTQTQLCKEITARTGLVCDPSYLNRIFTGVRNAPRIKKAIADITGISEGANE